MAVIKHIAIKNSNYDAAYDYLTTKHDEFTSKPILNEHGKRIPRASLIIISSVSIQKTVMTTNWLQNRSSLLAWNLPKRYEKSPLIITTNLPMGRWDELFTGKLATTAILDRLVHHCHVIIITGDSYHVKSPKTRYYKRVVIGKK